MLYTFYAELRERSERATKDGKLHSAPPEIFQVAPWKSRYARGGPSMCKKKPYIYWPKKLQKCEMNHANKLFLKMNHRCWKLAHTLWIINDYFLHLRQLSNSWTNCPAAIINNFDMWANQKYLPKNGFHIWIIKRQSKKKHVLYSEQLAPINNNIFYY